MFGYVKPFVPDLRVKEHEFYKSIYCGLCRSMKKHTGGISSFTLSYDMVFFALVRLLLSDTEPKIRRRRCMAHPLKTRLISDDNPELEYSARASALLVYFDCKDGIHDEKGLKRLFFRAALPYAKRMKKRAALPESEKFVSESLHKLSELEAAKCPSPDMAADAFGELLGGLMSYGFSDAEKNIAYQTGFHTGRWVYLADAVCDYPDDVSKSNYNPFIYAFDKPEDTEKFFSEKAEEILTLELSEIEKAIILADKTKNNMLYECINNIIHGGMKTSFEFSVERRRRNEKRPV